MITSVDVQFIGGYHETCGRHHEYIGRYSVHRGDIMSTSRGYHEYFKGHHDSCGDLTDKTILFAWKTTMY